VDNLCKDLFSHLMDCLADLDLRYEEMLTDRRVGQGLFDRPDKIGWLNHQKRYNNIRNMMDRLADYWNDHCDDRGSGWMTMANINNLETAMNAIDRPPPDEPLPANGFKLPGWAVGAGVVVVGGAIVIGAGVTLPAWGLGALGIMGATVGLSVVRQ
jgi:hypothetical protein